MPVVSRVFERLLHKQMSFHVEKYLSPYLCDYPKGFSTQQALLSLLERWKNILDRKGYGGAGLMDLSIAFSLQLSVSSINKKLFNKSLAKNKGHCGF